MISPRSRSPSRPQPMSNKSRRTGLKSRATQLLALRFGWVVLVIWYEVGEFFFSLSTCHFPDSQLRKASSTTPTHVVLLADPHVPHPRLSYPPDTRPWMNILRQAMDELFMRKSWNVVTRLGRIDAVIVVGDMLDWGRGVMSDIEYENYHSLFRSIFQLPSTTPMYFVPGNHDIPLGPNRLFSPHSRQRYADHFASPNAILSIANHSFILLDAIGLVEEDYRRYAAEMQFGEWDGIEGGVIEFVKALGDEPPPSPILISHIPLARSEAASCGPRRERGHIQKGAGPGYQNLLGSETSRFLLEAIRPSVVFSGDDHDYCELIHPNGIKEVTIKSFSSSTGIRRPGFQLLSLIPSSPGKISHADVPCTLPDQLGVYNQVYLPFAVLTFVYLLITNIRTAWWRPASPKPRLSPNTEGSRRERPVPLTLPSRKSSQHLQSLTMSTPRRGHASPLLAPSTKSAPVSPLGSPRMSFAEDFDAELGEGPSPNMSRRSSYATEMSAEPTSYFLPVPGSQSGLGISSPAPIRRPSSATIAPNGGGMQSNGRRATLPRMLSASDWAAAARAKDKSILGMVVDTASNGRGTRGIRSFARVIWRTRNGVLGKSWREMLAIAWPAGVVWIIMNALFFWH